MWLMMDGQRGGCWRLEMASNLEGADFHVEEPAEVPSGQPVPATGPGRADGQGT
jgi:hypothetical protein